MKYAAFSLNRDPGKTRVGSISTDGKLVEEFDLGVDVSEDGIVAILRADLHGKLPKPITSHAFEDIRLLAPVPRPRRNIFCVGKTIMNMLKNFLIADLIVALKQVKIFRVTLFSLPNLQSQLLAPIQTSSSRLQYQLR